MKVLAINAYYDPEIAASLYLSTNLYEDMASRGHVVELHTPMPSRGIDQDTRTLFKKRRKEIKCGGNLVIRRFSMFKESKNNCQRILRYLLTNIVSLWIGLNSDFDVIFVQSTPPTQGMIAALIKMIKKKPFVYSLQDIFPDSLVNGGLIAKGSLTWKMGRLIEDFTYKHADKIVVISDDFKKTLANKGVVESKIETVYNWVDQNSIISVDRERNILIDKYNLDIDKFYISYCGNIGYSQNLDMLLDVAYDLRDFESVHFLIFGDGAYKNKLELNMKQKGISNVTIFPFQPYEIISHVFSIGDIGLIISKANIGQNSIPSKTWSIMAAERFIIASFDNDSELCKVIQSANCGEIIPPNDPDQLKSLILKIYQKKEVYLERGKNGRKYILEHLTREIGTSKYIRIIEAVINK